MTGRVVVIASGETERRALPHLVSHLKDRGANVVDVRIPPRNGALEVGMVEKLIKAAWYGSLPQSPDKFVLVVDVDRKNPVDVVAPFRERLTKRLRGIDACVQYAYARQHLEAWYFADAGSLKTYLGRALGNVDTSKPDEIDKPKEHLRNLLADRVYTARVSEEIVRALDPKTIYERSPSFKGFLDAVMNGDGPPT